MRRIGDDKVIPLDIRIIAAGNRHMLQLCAEGRFRYDLYYRLNVLRLTIPPLRERGDDILLIFRHYMAKFLGEDPRAIVIGEECERLLLDYSWPGNVRELRNIAEALSFSGPIADAGELKELINAEHKTEDTGYSLRLREQASLKEVEHEYLSRLAKRYSQAEICRIAGLSRTSLWRKLREE